MIGNANWYLIGVIASFLSCKNEYYFMSRVICKELLNGLFLILFWYSNSGKNLLKMVVIDTST